MTDKPKRVTKKEMIHGASSDTSKIIFTKDDIFSGRMFTNKQLMDCLIQHMNQCIDLGSKLKIAREALEFYGEGNNWFDFSNPSIGSPENRTFTVGGKRARAALREIDTNELLSSTENSSKGG